MPKVRMRLTFPSTVLDFSAEHPGVEFTIQSSWPTGDDLLTIMEIKAQNPEAVLPVFDESPDVHVSEVLYTDDRTMLIRLSTADPPPHRVARTVGALPPFPLVVRNGWIISETTITYERLSEFKKELDRADITYDVMSVTQSTDAIELLTDRQRQFIGEALKRGYYDNPRRCSLTDLAASLEVSKPTAS